MPYSLKGRNVLVTGGSRGLGALICERFAAEGSNVAINYHSNGEAAENVAKKVEAHGGKAIIVKGDAGVGEDNSRMIKETVEKLGGLDIIIANAGWTRFSTFGDLNDLSDDEWTKCWNTNVLCHVQLMREAGPILNKNPDGGVYILTSSIAGIGINGSSMGYSVTKAAGLHLMKCLASTQGSKIRINAILPGLLLTDWGLRYGEERLAKFKDKALLKQETILDDCVDAYISTAKNTSMTGQQVAIDSGLALGLQKP